MRKIALLSICSVLFLAGCANKESKIVGSWTPEGAAGKSMTFVFKADHKFDVTGVIPMAGTWKLDDNKITLKMETIAGRPVTDPITGVSSLGLDKPQEGTLSDDAKSITLPGATLKKTS